MFDFGKNWQKFSNTVTDKDFEVAKQSLKGLFGKNGLQRKNFIDVGCGSGLFSIAAKQLGAKKTVGIDILPSSIQCSQDNATKYNVSDVDFHLKSALDPSINELGGFDIVYAWGSLHHTGNMWGAIENVSRLVKPGGLYILAIYNKNFSSPFWKFIKWTHHYSPHIIKRFIEILYIAIIIPLKVLVFRKKFFRKKRGMKIYYDAVDWVGGYPFEYATKSEVVEFLNKREFKLIKYITTLGISGTNQFVFERIYE